MAGRVRTINKIRKAIMSLSRPEIEAMKESDLREKVLVPLVKAMDTKMSSSITVGLRSWVRTS